LVTSVIRRMKRKAARTIPTSMATVRSTSTVSRNVVSRTATSLFGAAEMFKDRVGRIAGKPKVLILRLRHVPAIDSTGLHALRDVIRRSEREGTLVLLSDVHAQPVVALERSGLYDELGEENIHGNIDDALNRARAHLGLPPVAPPQGATPTVARETPAGEIRMS